MEKLICALWAGDGQSAAAFNAALIDRMVPALHAAGARAIRINVRDDDVTPAAELIQTWQAPQQDAVVQFWLPSANARFRSDIDAILAGACDRFAAWLVAESTIIANEKHPPVCGQRTWGWSQASFISFRPDMTRDAAIAHWHSHHTRIAIETQANFEYVQNLIVKPLTPDAPAYDALVEECFSEAAMTNSPAFFDAVGDEAKFAANTAAMFDSCTAFIDFSRIDIIPTSQFDFAALDHAAAG